jgi:hypothetical protein
MSDASKIDSTDSSITGFMWDWCGAGRPDPKPLRSMRLKKTIIWQLKLAETIIRTNTDIDDNMKINIFTKAAHLDDFYSTWFSQGSRC